MANPYDNFEDSQGELLNIPMSEWDPRTNTFSRNNGVGGRGGGVPISAPANITSQGASAATAAGAGSGAGMAGTAGLAIPAIVQGFASLYGASQAAGASRDAAKAMERMGYAAMDFEKEKYNQSRADLAPWQEMGGGAMMKLAEALGINPMQLRQPEPITPSSPGRGAPGNTGRQAQPRNGGRLPISAVVGRGPGQRAMPRNAGPQPQQGSGGMVIIQAPDGEQRPVPEHLVEQYVSRGGRVVGRAS